MAQLHRLRDDIDNIQPGFDFINRSHNWIIRENGGKRWGRGGKWG